MNGDGFFELLSQEGTTQGCPLAMAMYALSLVPLVKVLHPLPCDWLTSSRKMREWFDLLPYYGQIDLNGSQCLQGLQCRGECAKESGQLGLISEKTCIDRGL